MALKLPTLDEVNRERRAQAKSASAPQAVVRRARRAADAKRLADCYADVDVRDAGICWATGRFTVAGAVDARQRREHHHLKGRRVRPDWIFRPERVITLCAEAHQLVTAGWLVIEGCDARRAIFCHWAPHVKVKPFELRAKRTIHE